MKTLINNLKGIKSKFIEKDNDYLLIIDGREGSGKSTLGLHACSVVDKTFSHEDVAFTAKDFLTKLHKSKVKKALMWDEAVEGAFSRDSINRTNKMIVTAMMVARAKKIFIIVIIPTFFLLDKYFRMHRVGMLLNLPRRGLFNAYNSKAIKKLSVDGSKYWDYSKGKISFSEQFPIFDKQTTLWKEYYKKKKAFMKDFLEASLKKMELGSKFQSALFNFYVKTPYTQRELGEILGMSLEPINRYINAERGFRGISAQALETRKAENIKKV